MKYCPKCRKLYFDDDLSKCNKCKNKKLSDDLTLRTAVWLCRVNSAMREQIVALLNDNFIPFYYDTAKENTGMGFEEYDVYVAYGCLKKAYILCSVTGAVEMPVDIEALDDLSDSVDKDIFATEDMSPVKRRIVRITSAILFFLLVCVVVFGVDYIGELIIKLFS